MSETVAVAQGAATGTTQLARECPRPSVELSDKRCAKKRGRKPLPTIDVDAVEDHREKERLLKLVRSRQSASESRNRQRAKQLAQEAQLQTLEQENARLKAALAHVLGQLVKYHKGKKSSRMRVKPSLSVAPRAMSNMPLDRPLPGAGYTAEYILNQMAPVTSQNQYASVARTYGSVAPKHPPMVHNQHTACPPVMHQLAPMAAPTDQGSSATPIHCFKDPFPSPSTMLFPNSLPAPMATPPAAAKLRDAHQHGGPGIRLPPIQPWAGYSDASLRNVSAPSAATWLPPLHSPVHPVTASHSPGGHCSSSNTPLAQPGTMRPKPASYTALVAQKVDGHPRTTEVPLLLPEMDPMPPMERAVEDMQDLDWLVDPCELLPDTFDGVIDNIL